MANIQPQADKYGLKFIIPILLTVLGWYVAYRLSAKQDHQNKRRDIKITYLIDAYRKLANGSMRDTFEYSYQLDMESAIADIQLFGSPEQIGLLKAALNKSAELTKQTGKVEIQLDLLMIDLRNSLRDELDLEQVEGNVRWFRFPHTNLNSTSK